MCLCQVIFAIYSLFPASLIYATHDYLLVEKRLVVCMAHDLAEAHASHRVPEIFATTRADPGSVIFRRQSASMQVTES